jgi:hypothetical protein
LGDEGPDGFGVCGLSAADHGYANFVYLEYL